MGSEHLFKPSSTLATKKKNRLPENPEQKEGKLNTGRFPSWLHRKLPQSSNLWGTHKELNKERLHTVCEEAKCPNLLECYSKKTATFLTMGKTCTRRCGFCSIDFSNTPPALEENEPARVSASVKELGLKHVVLTMVARDDIEDGGATQLKAIIERIRDDNPHSTVEVLTSDFQGNSKSLETIMRATPEVFNHNLETIERLSPRVRHKASYERSLKLLTEINKNYRSKIRFLKSGLMLGLGETEEEIFKTLKDLKESGCDIVTMGQYLQPTKNHLLVKRFVSPEEFDTYAEMGREIGIPHMYCGPFVRSSYNAELFI